LEYNFEMSVSMRSPVHTIKRSASDASEGVQDFASQRTVNAASLHQSTSKSKYSGQSTFRLTIIAQERRVANDAVE
jgi:hypothetical protein